MAGLAAIYDLPSSPHRHRLEVDLGRIVDFVDSGRGLEVHTQVEAPVAFGALDLRGIEASRPSLSASGRVFVALDGELESGCSKGGAAERLAGDYEKLGIRAVADLSGVFCGALWDAEARELHLFTDRLGLGVLYWTRCGDTIAASSQLRGFLGLPGFRPSLDRRAAGDLFNHGFVLGDDTLLDGVRLVPAATVLSFDEAGRKREWRYWHPRFSSTARPAAEATSRFEDAFVRCLTANRNLPGRWGTTLSGGLDSRMVTAVFREHDTRPLAALTYGSRRSDEYRFAKVAAEALGVEHHLFELTPAGMLDGYPRAIWQTDGMAAVSDLYLAGCFDRLGDLMDVRLDGYLGDALLGGTYLSQRLLGARSFDDSWPVFWPKVARWFPRVDPLLDPRWRAQITEQRLPRLRATWEGAELEGRPCDRTEWFLCQNRGRRFIHYHHSLLVRGTVKSIKPFVGYDAVDATWAVPAEQRLGHAFYHDWIVRHHPRMAALPVIGGGSPLAPRPPPRWSITRARIHRVVRLASLGFVSLPDRRTIRPNGWHDRRFRRAIQAFLSSERVLSRGYLEPKRFRRHLAVSGTQDAFWFLSILYQLEWFHRLFLESDADGLHRVGAPVRSLGR